MTGSGFDWTMSARSFGCQPRPYAAGATKPPGSCQPSGVVLPVVSLRRLLGFPDAPVDETARVIVIDRGDPVDFSSMDRPS
jgi:hypothetical protein